MSTVGSALQLMWQGMVSIFVVIAAICVVVMIVNKVTGKSKKAK
ncbi:MAG: hypothetical protein RR632_05410 [Christensenella sp.]